MGGFHGPERLTHHAAGRLEANIVVLGRDDGALVLVAIDALFVGAALTARVTEACRARFGVGPERVLVLASHTHFAPMLDADKPALGRCDQAELARWGAGIEAALDSAVRKSATHGRAGLGLSDASVNRRLRWPWPTAARILGKTQGDVYMCDNPLGPRDPRIRTRVWFASDGSALAALWSFACHPVFFPQHDTSSPDFVGVVRDALRRHLGDPALPVIFAPGCMGDLWPRSPRPWKSIYRAFHFALYGPLPVPYGQDDWDAWSEQLAHAVVAADAEGEVSALDNSDSRARMACVPLSRLLDGEDEDRVLTAKAIVAPGIGQLIAMNCEPVSEIAGLSIEPDAIIVGYESDVFGYLPTSAMVREGGYEPRKSLAYFGLRGRFRDDLDETVTDLLRSARL